MSHENKIVTGIHVISKSTPYNFSELQQLIKDKVMERGYQVTEEQLQVITEDNSRYYVGPKSPATFASFAWHEPYRLLFIFKDPQIQSKEQFLQSKANKH